MLRRDTRFLLPLLFICHSAPLLAQTQALPTTRPTFECDEAHSTLARVICSSPDAIRADWDLNAAFWARFGLIEGDQPRQQFWNEQVKWLRSLGWVCNLVDGQITFARQQSNCIVGAYNRRANEMRAMLSGDALAESRYSPEAMLAIQQRLVDIGLLTSKIDGQFGPRTREAIRQFQLLLNVSQSGFLTQAQQRQLLSASTAHAVELESSNDSAAATYNRLSETQQQELQMLLAAAGHSTDVSTSRGSRKLSDSISRFQANNQMPTDGKISERLLTQLREAAGPILRKWKLTAVQHSVPGTRLWLPMGLALRSERIRFGIRYVSDDFPLLISFLHVPSQTIGDAYQNIVSELSGSAITQRHQRPDFFVLVGDRKGEQTYVRFHSLPTGVVGFVLKWSEDADIFGNRLAVAMSDLFVLGLGDAATNVGVGLDR